MTEDTPAHVTVNFICAVSWNATTGVRCARRWHVVSRHYAVHGATGGPAVGGSRRLQVSGDRRRQESRCRSRGLEAPRRDLRRGGRFVAGGWERDSLLFARRSWFLARYGRLIISSCFICSRWRFHASSSDTFVTVVSRSGLWRMPRVSCLLLRRSATTIAKLNTTSVLVLMLV